MWAPSDLHRVLSSIVAELQERGNGQYSVHLARCNALLAEYDPEATPVFDKRKSLRQTVQASGPTAILKRVGRHFSAGARYGSALLALLGALHAAWQAYQGAP